nr:primase C-terminal domain-containing protein [Bacteroides sp. D2]
MSHIFLRHLIAEQRHSNVFKLACEACRRHYPQESILRELTAFFKHTDFRPKELTSVYCLNTNKLMNMHPLPPHQRTLLSKGHKDKKDIWYYRKFRCRRRSLLVGRGTLERSSLISPKFIQ